MSHEHEIDYDSFAYDSVVAFLEEHKHSYEVERFKSRALFSYTLPCDDSADTIRAEIFVKPFRNKFSFYAYSPYTLHPSQKEFFLDLFATNNFDNNLIKFELNPDSGSVRLGMTCYLIPDLVSREYLSRLERQSVEMLRVMLPMLGDARFERKPSQKC